jgi:hypothetical protein
LVWISDIQISKSLVDIQINSCQRSLV